MATTEKKVARGKLNLLCLAQELCDVSRACKVVGSGRQKFYEIRRNYQTNGAPGLLDKLAGCKGPHRNRIAPEIEEAILDYSLAPIHGPLRVAQKLALRRVTGPGDCYVPPRPTWLDYPLMAAHWKNCCSGSRSGCAGPVSTSTLRGKNEMPEDVNSAV